MGSFSASLDVCVSNYLQNKCCKLPPFVLSFETGNLHKINVKHNCLFRHLYLGFFIFCAKIHSFILCRLKGRIKVQIRYFKWDFNWNSEFWKHSHMLNNNKNKLCIFQGFFKIYSYIDKELYHSTPFFELFNMCPHVSQVSL